jgi:hypothetical protein
MYQIGIKVRHGMKITEFQIKSVTNFALLDSWKAILARPVLRCQEREFMKVFGARGHLFGWSWCN